MSRNEWEYGTLTLPSAAVAPLKKTLREWVNALHEEVRTEAVRLHKEVAKGTRSASLYRQRLRADQQAAWDRERADRGYRLPSASQMRAEDRRDLVTAAAREVLTRMLWHAERTSVAPHQPKVADVARVVPKMTNRDDRFPVLDRDGLAAEASITFAGREVTWSVPENNHAVEHAHAAPLAEVFFAALGRVAWTRGTGGVLVGNDEYNKDSYSAGGGANYPTAHYGPLGQEAKITEHMSRGFNRKQATEMVAAANRPVRSNNSRYATWR